MADGEDQPQLSIDAAQALLKPFLEANPSAVIEEEEKPDSEKALVIRRPWGDSSIVIHLPNDPGKLADALNNLLLPARYSAIWHKDTKAFEILWTAFKPSGRSVEVVGREFSFKFRGREFQCSFAPSSERILLLAAAFRPTGQTETNYRNLWSYQVFVSKNADKELLDELGGPFSFWIRDVEWDEDEVLALTTHLNFYINYFDASSPIIVFHSPPITAAKRPTRYPAGSFPKNITSTEIDAPLLYLWEAARGGDPTQRFLYYYRVIEYAAAVYLDSSARATLRKALALPNALDDLAAVTETIVAAFQKMKMEDIARYDAMLKEVIDPKLLWGELSLNISAFTTDTQFEGGFKVSALFVAGRKEADYTSQDVYIFGRTIRDMRNALSHGREQKSGTTITPTTHNSAKLQPWSAPVRLVASQVILYKGVF